MSATYDKKKLSDLVRQAKGERTIRQYANDTGISPSIISRILSEDYKPGAEMIKRLVKKSSNPRGNVTANDLMIAAGYLEKDTNKELFTSIGTASLATIATISLATVSPVSAILASQLAGKAIGKTIFDISNKKTKAGMLLDEVKTKLDSSDNIENHFIEQEKKNKDFIKKAMRGIMLSLLEKDNLLIGKSDINSLQSYVLPDELLNVSNNKIETWWFKFYNCEDDSILLELSETKAIVAALFGSFVTIPEDPKRKLSFVVNNEEIYKEFIKLKRNNSYKGNVSVVLVDKNGTSVVSEEFISYFNNECADKLIKIIWE